MIFFIFSFEICVTSATLNEVFFTLSCYVYLDILFLKLAFAVWTSKFSFFTVHEVVSDFISCIFLFTIHAFNFCIRAFFLNMTHNLISLKMSFATKFCMRTQYYLKFAVNLFMKLKFIIVYYLFTTVYLITAS